MSKALTFSSAEFVSHKVAGDVYYSEKTFQCTKAQDTSNAKVYYLAINTWCHLVYDLADDMSALHLRDHIVRYGLLPSIEDCDEYADALISGLSEARNVSLPTPTSTTMWLFDMVNTIFYHHGLTEVLQALRFCKRLTLAFSSSGAQEISDLITTNNRNKMFDRRNIPAHILRFAKPYLKDVSDLTIYREKRHSSGATSDAVDKTYFEKERANHSSRLTLMGNPIHSDLEGIIPPDIRPDLWTVSPILVPKNYKKKRLIAPEATARQFEMSAIASGMQKALAHCSAMSEKSYPIVILDDQEVSRVAARLSAHIVSKRRYATIDLSSASDTVRVAEVKELFPQSLALHLCKFRAKWLMTAHGQNHTSYIYSTAGARTTFPCESAIFAAIAYSATQWCQLFSTVKLLPPIVYGDDIMVDESVSSTLVEFLGTCGHIVNTSKTFQAGFFKESCGMESFQGVDVSSSYFPRHEFQFSKGKWIRPDDIDAIVSLQHRVYRYRHASAFLCSYVRESIPDFTSSYPMTDCSDLWEDDPFFVPVHLTPCEATGYEVITRRQMQDYPDHECRELHHTLVAEFPNRSEANDYQYSNYYSCEYEEMVYGDYLELGPNYEDPLSELLGVSASRRKMVDCVIPRNSYKLIPR